jgi:exopolysaccharide biosynthesis polyprenyl glycosylphosphotransferase
MLANYPVLGRILILIIDSVVTVFSYIFALKLRHLLGLSDTVEWKFYTNLLLIIMIVWGALFEYQEAYAGKAYRTSRYLGSFRSLKKEIIIVARIILVGCPLVYLIAYLVNISIPQPYYNEWIMPKSFLAIFAGINFLLLALERYFIYQVSKTSRKKKEQLKRVLILGTGDITKQIINTEEMGENKVLGLIAIDNREAGQHIKGYEILGSMDEMPRILHSHHIDELIIALPAHYMGNIEEIIERCDREGVPVRIVSPFFKNLISKSRTEMAYGFPNVLFKPSDRNDLEAALKRLLDIIISCICLVLLTPLLLFIAIMIKIDSPGPIFYKWKILGLHKKPLDSYKFRTMVENADEMKEQLLANNEMKSVAFKMRDDPRITRMGRWLRKYSLDELPQLWSVLKGDLSLVGPRPPLQTEIEQYEGWHRRKLSVKPGITCLWQISGRNEITDFNEWMKLDLKYIDEWTLWWDIKILFKTFFIVLKGTGM